ncbi:MAG: glycoside hydrolase family 32 protein [Planctomycetaceae bacterium]
MIRVALAVVLALGGGLAARVRGADAPRPDIVVADFEGDSYGDWKVEGTAFGTAPARGALAGQMAVDGFRGRGLVNSFAGGDASTGTLESPPFTIERAFVAFLIGGGNDPGRLALELLVDGAPVRSATGSNDRPGGSETLLGESWDVAALAGKTARLRVVDAATGGWGHVNVDHVVQTDVRPKGTLQDVRRDIVADRRYLQIPIRNGAAKRVVTLLVDGEPVVRNDVELADGRADWWAPMDVSGWRGRTLSVVVDRIPEDSTALEAIRQSDAFVEPGIGDPLYAEALRGQFHFSPRRGWNNDPNGLVFFGGEYHLFFQHNPYGWGWGNMHWGHAVSRDLVHWEELGDVLLPDAMGPMFSGSAVVDWNNTSGLGRDGTPPLVLAYTAAGNPTVQCLASSIDGRTFEKFAGNPVLPQITPGNRDPKIVWHAATGKWVMVLYVEEAGTHTIHFFTSPDLKAWTFTGKVDGFFECPDLFELPLDGDARQGKWVLLGASSEYRVGSFDGRTFTPETEKLPGHRGRGFYAAQSFSDVPAGDGRRILMGWFQTETRGMPFNQSMTVPLELGLVSTPEGPRMTFRPVAELASLRTASHRIPIEVLAPGDPISLAGVSAELVEIRAGFEPAAGTDVAFRVRGVDVVWESKTGEIVVHGHRAPAPARDGRQQLVILADRTGLEVFAAGGLTYVPMPVNPRADDLAAGVAAIGGPVRVHALEIHELGSAWEPGREGAP